MKIKKSKVDIITEVCFYGFIAIFALICLFPFILVVTSSFADEVGLAKEGYKLIPSKWSLDAYRLLLETKSVFNARGLPVN